MKMPRPEWARNAVRRLKHAAPATFWRSLDGLSLDFASIPRRIRDPSRRNEPLYSLHHVGGGDFRQAGIAWLGTLMTIGKMEPNEIILDIGCGNGRMALPIVEQLSDDGYYVGFDISVSAINFCKRRFANNPRVQFHQLDIRNGIYNPKGTILEDAVIFPVADSSITLAFATSVITHLTRQTAQHYFNETMRVLKPGGRALFTAFILTPTIRANIADGRAHIQMQPFDPGCMVSDPQWPEAAIAFDEDIFREMISSAGLRLEHLLHGEWSGSPTYPGGQDLLVVSRSSDTREPRSDLA